MNNSSTLLTIVAGYVLLGENKTRLPTWAALAVGFAATVVYSSLKVVFVLNNEAGAEEPPASKKLSSMIGVILLVLNPLIISMG